MKFSNLIMLKILSFILCNNLYLRIIIVSILISELIFRKNKKDTKKIKDVVMGSCIIFLNYILSIDLMIVNFLVLGVISSIFYFIKVERLINFYLFVVASYGVILTCLNL